jgi:hypothetical protein
LTLDAARNFFSKFTISINHSLLSGCDCGGCGDCGGGGDGGGGESPICQIQIVAWSYIGACSSTTSWEVYAPWLAPSYFLYEEGAKYTLALTEVLLF